MCIRRGGEGIRFRWVREFYFVLSLDRVFELDGFFLSIGCVYEGERAYVGRWFYGNVFYFLEVVVVVVVRCLRGER